VVTVTAVKAAIVAVLDTIEGLARNEYRVPRSIARADLPLGLVMTGPATYDAVGTDTDVDLPTRIYRIRIYVAPISAGADGEIEALVEPFFGSVPAAFAADPRLGRTVLRAKITRDQGVKTLPFAQQDYIGTEFDLEVRT
jgi:hypothetical protein